MSPRPVPAGPLGATPALPVLALCGWALLSGCSSRGPSLFDVSGTVTFNGRPVPFGKVYFNPDPMMNPASPQGFADIKDGRYDTAQSGRGTPGGAFTVRMEGFDGHSTAAFPYGQLLFDDYQVKVELPAENTRKDFDVPASAARKGPKAAP
jgi:hypothetical protein